MPTLPETSIKPTKILILDRGPGIPESSQKEVFTPFYRLETSRNKSTGGVGLGLSAARAIVLEHGGDLHLRNCHAGGLEASIMLPHYPAEPND